ncbi:MAG: MFS transporter [Dehalococcoidia bacterium]|nr:MFS transporter [Dehalococcoidia bacterium]
MGLSKGTTPNYGWVVVGAFLAIDAIIMGITFSLGLMLPLISDDLNMTLGQSSWLGAVNWEVSALLSIPVAFRLSRYSPKALVTISCLGEAPLLLIQGLAPNYWVLLVCRIAYMAIGLARFAARPILIQQWFPREKVPLVNGVLTVGMGLAGGTVVFFMGDIMAALDGWRNTFYVFGAITAVLMAIWMILGRENPASGVKEQPQEPGALKAILGNKTLWLVGIGVTGDMLCFGAMETLWPTYATAKGFVSLQEASFCEGLSYYGFTVGSILGGWLTMRLGRRKPLLMVSGLMLPLVTMGVLFSRSFPVLASLWFVWGLVELYYPVTMTIPYELPGIKPQGVVLATALVVTVVTAGSGLGPLLAGYVAGAIGLEKALLVTCFFPLLLFASGLLIAETGPRGPAVHNDAT